MLLISSSMSLFHHSVYLIRREYFILGENESITIENQPPIPPTSKSIFTSSYQNPRFSVASTASNTSNDNKASGNNQAESQLVVAQIHHDPIIDTKKDESSNEEEKAPEVEKICPGKNHLWSS